MAEFCITKREHPPRKDEGVYEISIGVTGMGRDRDGYPQLFPECITVQEWDHQIDSLIKRIEELRIEGKEFLKG